MAENPFEIPQSLRDLAEQNIKHAHAAYEQLSLPALVSVGRIRQVRLRSCVALAAVKRVLVNLQQK